MKLVMSSFNEFIYETADQQIYCFGASRNIQQMLSNYWKTGLALRISGIVDNDISKHGMTLDTTFGSWNIISMKQFVNEYKSNDNIVLLIMPELCFEIVEQIRNIRELKDIKCYIHRLFPFFSHNESLPDELIKLRMGKPRIPKVIHYVWFGEKPLPDKYKKNIEGWKRLCPDYEIKLWNEDNYDVNKIQYIKEAYKAGVNAFASDCARIDIINTHGGIYFDTDVELLKNIDDLLYSESFFSVSNNGFFNSGDGFGAVAGNAITNSMLEVYKNIQFYHNESPLCANGWKETVVLCERSKGLGLNNSDITVLKDAVIYPTEYFSAYSTIFGIPNITSNSYSLHCFETSWLDEKLRERRAECQAYFTRIFNQGVRKIYELN
jgi:hypothetical protein